LTDSGRRREIVKMLIHQNVRAVFYSTLAIIVAIAGLTDAPATAAGFDPPIFWDGKRRPDKPDMRTIRQIRFLTEDDYPPFNFTGASGRLDGFNVDIARAICIELAVPCTVQARRWDTIVAALEAGQGDAIAASLAVTPESRERLSFTDAYFRSPARFVGRNAGPAELPATLAGRKIAVVAVTAHEAFLRATFPNASVLAKPTDEAAREGLKTAEADLLFGDGVALAFWLNGSSSGGCCRFVGGPFLETRYFGEGIAIAVRPRDALLRQAIDFALFRLWEKGTYADLVRRWFPVNPYAAAN
jgi:polar amino acid transport system substrate-binding protein